MTVHMLDVSNFQPDSDLTQARNAGWDAVMIKASEGVGFVDPQVVPHSQGAAQAGMLSGYYHFCRADLGNSPEDEADHFFKVVGAVPPGTLIALDSETGTGELSAWVLRCLARTQSNFGTKPWLYTGGWFAAGRLTYTALGSYPLWDSSYTGAWPQVFTPWSSIAMWQYTDSAWVPGVGHVDASIYPGTLAELAATGKPGVPPVPKPPPTPAPPPPITGPQPPYVTAPVYEAVTAHYLRLVPKRGSAHVEAGIVARGDLLTAAPAPRGLPSWTTSFRWCLHQQTHASGYAYAPLLKAAVSH